MPPDAIGSSIRRSTLAGKSDDPSRRSGSSAATDYDGRAHVMQVLDEARSDESAKLREVPMGLDSPYPFECQASSSRIAPVTLLADSARADVWLPAGYSLKLVHSSPGATRHLLSICIVTFGEVVAELSLDEQACITALKHNRRGDAPIYFATALHCLSDIPLFSKAAQRFGVPSMTPEARADQLSKYIFDSFGGSLMDLKKITAQREDEGMPVSFREIPHAFWGGPLATLMERITSGTYALSTTETNQAIDVAFELVRELSPEDALSVLFDFSLTWHGVAELDLYPIECAMKELSRLSPLTPHEHATHATVLATIIAAIPADTNLPDEVFGQIVQLPDEHRARPMRELVRRARVGDKSFESLWRESCTRPQSEQRESVQAFAEGLRHVDDEIFALLRWNEIRDVSSRLFGDDPITHMQITADLARAIVKLPAKNTREAYALLQRDIESSNDAVDSLRARIRRSEVLIAMIHGLPALAHESHAGNMQSPSAIEAEQWILVQVQAFSDQGPKAALAILNRADENTTALFGALRRHRASFDILLDAAKRIPDESEREAALATLCQDVSAGFTPLDGSVPFLRWYRLAVAVQESLPEARRERPYRLLRGLHLNASVHNALRKIVDDGPENVGKGKWIIDFHPSEDQATLRQREV